ncbi:TlpA disulfide reductase family protein [Chitinophaga sp. Cy-1792]|uniref:TlpA disulfide reductase family protein n=1 Tax=Chitinophaga sp. Cy-1792 TaxID=2608339 RepID=UPI00141E179D|nr:TlpA disulfide reductase family protein [Chitinophaga sp. Cy-1792]NIG55831.1 AhpC/TSA family protein [Chitinophaga sp. Cy-1792]
MNKCKIGLLIGAILIGILSVNACAQGGGGYTISGRIKGIGNTKVFLTNKPYTFTSAFKVIIYDSCFSKDDYFVFSGKLDDLKFLSIEVPSVSKSRFSFIGENKDIKIESQKDAIHAGKIVGSPQTTYYNYYLDSIYRPTKRNDNRIIDSLAALKDSAKSMELVNAYERMINRRNEAILYQLISEHPDSYGLLSEFNEISTFIPKDTAQKYYSVFSKKLRQTELGKRLNYELFAYDNLIKIGKKIPDFSLPDTVQRLQGLSAFKGKYVLLDFWASWCGPCLEELPHLKNIYNQYQTKGFEIVGISLDTQKKSWIESIKRNDILWTNLSDLKGRAGKVAQLLKIDAIPMKFLVGPDSKLLLINPTLADIEGFLSTLP